MSMPLFCLLVCLLLLGALLLGAPGCNVLRSLSMLSESGPVSLLRALLLVRRACGPTTGDRDLG